MAQVQGLTYDDENQDLTEFYETYLEFLKTCPVYVLDTSVIKTVAVMLHDTLYFDSDWQNYASEMGVTHNLHLATIQQSSKMTKELPLYITMRTTLTHVNGSLANIVKAFIKTKRYDVLRFLKPSVEKLLERIPDTEIKEYVNGDWNKNSDLSSGETITVSSLYDICTDQSESALSTELDPAFITKHPGPELNNINKNVVSELKLQSAYDKNSFQEVQAPSAPPAESLSILIQPSVTPAKSLSVLIQHTESDTEIARQLCQKLKSGGIAVTTLFDMEMLIRMDPTGALNKVFREVDFIVPVVSEEFLHQIDPQFCRDFETVSNRTLYQLITNEYQYNGSVNYRVRSVLVPGMKRSLKLTDNVILCYSFRLWDECEKLIRILKETKEIMKFHPLKMKRNF